MAYQKIEVPAAGERIRVNADYSLTVPDHPVIPFIEGDGIGVDITPVMRRVVDAAVDKAYGGKRRLAWMEIYAGEKSNAIYGENTWLPDETVAAIRDHAIAIKGPLTTPVGAASVPSMSPCASSWICMSACGRCATTRERRVRSGIRRRATW